MADSTLKPSNDVPGQDRSAVELKNSHLNEPLHVTRSYLPPVDEYMSRLKAVWASGQATNNGPLVRELEQKLAEYHGVNHALCVSNGDAGLHVAIRALDLTGEVITTPFSYVSTLSSLVWSGLKPVFADIDPHTFTVDPNLVEDSITDATSAILVTHVFGNPCDVEALEDIAQRHKLKLIYDAAHAFGVTYKGRGVLNFGDVSMVSLHATKLFHCGEGGLLTSNDEQLAHRLDWTRRFGHDGTEAFHGVGVNAKMSELHAAMGLCVLDHIAEVIAKRKATCQLYDQVIADLQLPLTKQVIREGASENYSYYPVLFESEAKLLESMEILAGAQVFPRRYFYPSLNTIKEICDVVSMPISESVASRILCLPLSTEMTADDVQRVVSNIVK